MRWTTRARPGVPLESYGSEAIRREYDSRKGCAPFCTSNCVQQVGLLDNWRSPQSLIARLPRPALAAPAGSGVRDETALVG